MSICDDIVNDYNLCGKMFHVNYKNIYDTELYLKFNRLTIEVVFSKKYLLAIESIIDFIDEYFLLHNRRPTIKIVGLDKECLLEYIDFLKYCYRMYISLLSKEETNFNNRDYIHSYYIQELINDLMKYDSFIFDDFRQFEIHTLVNIINGE